MGRPGAPTIEALPGGVVSGSRAAPGYPEVVLPYPSYLRVYEPRAALAASGGERAAVDSGGRHEATTAGAVTVAAEQETSLSRAVASSALPIDTGPLAGCYVLRRERRSYYCPVDFPLRSWLSFTSLVESVGSPTASLLFTAESLATADEEFLRWRRDHPRAVPHIRQTTWGIPRTWFVLVTEEERESYDAGGLTTVRYRARITDARRRVARAHAIVSRTLDEAELLDELVDLGSWLEAFHPASWVELDYAGVARLLGTALNGDSSARDISTALRALQQGDFAAAGACYRAFEERWRAVNAYERAN